MVGTKDGEWARECFLFGGSLTEAEALFLIAFWKSEPSTVIWVKLLGKTVQGRSADLDQMLGAETSPLTIV